MPFRRSDLGDMMVFISTVTGNHPPVLNGSLRGDAHKEPRLVKTEQLDLRRKPPQTHFGLDALIEKLKEEKQIELCGPDGVQWRLNVTAGSLIVSWLYNKYWYPLNRGWGFLGPVRDPYDKARVILGQILIGKRSSGMALVNLTCGFVISDSNPIGSRDVI